MGFGIGPRINAAGRLSDAKNAVKLMLTEDIEEADKLGEILEKENLERRELCEKITEEATEQVLKNINLNKEKVIVLGAQDWHHGVIGIVANRLVEKFHLPVFIVSLGDEKAEDLLEVLMKKT